MQQCVSQAITAHLLTSSTASLTHSFCRAIAEHRRCIKNNVANSKSQFVVFVRVKSFFWGGVYFFFFSVA